MEEVPQTPEQLEKNIIARRNPTSDLAYSLITGEPVKKSIEGTYSEVNIDASKQRACW
jgi:hypothetical protein